MMIAADLDLNTIYSLEIKIAREKKSLTRWLWTYYASDSLLVPKLTNCHSS